MVRAAMSPPVVWMFSDGTSLVSAVARSVAPVLVSAVAPTTWIGAALLAALTPVVRVPVTMTSLTVLLVSAANAAGAASAVASATMLVPRSADFMSYPPVVMTCQVQIERPPNWRRALLDERDEVGRPK